MNIERKVEGGAAGNPTYNNQSSEQEHKKSAQKSGTEKEETPNDFDARLKQAQDELEKSGESGWVA